MFFISINKVLNSKKYLSHEYPCDKNKIIISMNYLDKKFHNYFKKYLWYELTYKYYQILNILRILQYSKNNNIVLILINYLNRLY